MNILFIHQNFPGQFKNLAPALAARGDRCVALTLRVKKASKWKGVEVLPYQVRRKPGEGVHPWLVDFNTKLHRAEACFAAALQLKERGFVPDVIIAHPGWGESLFLRDVWPEARIGLYYELFYQAQAGDSGFDPEFSNPDAKGAEQRLRMKNINNFLHYPLGDRGICPTEFQARSFPETFRERISVIHDGVDTKNLAPNPGATFELPDGEVLNSDSEVITFVNRNLEPYRGFHIFMRTLPKLLKRAPKARVLIVGGDGQSYGAAAPEGKTWKQIFTDEVRRQISDDDWNRVHFLGKLPYDRFISMLQLTSVHVYLTYPFVLSWSLLEAMSCGACIVASKTEPVEEVITHDKNGMLVDFFDQDALCDAVLRGLSDHELRLRMRESARAFAKTHYDLKSVCLPRQLAWVDELSKATPGKKEPYA